MSVLIKGMDMPKSCSECELRYIAIGLDFQCAISGETVDDFYETRHPNCALVAISTPHGRLIDADELIRCLPKWLADTDVMRVFERIIKRRPTITEAEVNE